MIAALIWTALTIAIALWNQFVGQPFVGIRFFQDADGRPLNGAWLAATVALYTWIRYFYRRWRAGKSR